MFYARVHFLFYMFSENILILYRQNMSQLNYRKPVLVLDEKRCKNNIKKMAEKAERNGCIFRPHFKTHQSIEIGKWFQETGVRGITVSSTGMAGYFASAGWNDITIAFPFFPYQIPALSEVEKHARLRLFVNSETDLELLNEELKNSFEVVIEIDPGYGRSGIHYQNRELIESLIKKSGKLQKSKFHGFYVHEGRTYQAGSAYAVQAAIKPVIQILNELKAEFPEASLSLGDTPSASLNDNFEGIDELTPGNFVFYDWMQVQIGSCSLNDVSLFAVLPVAQHFKTENRAILHGGAAHLSKDYVMTNGINNYGQMVSNSASEIIELPNAFITALSQEHGTLSGLPDSFDEPVAWICPIHSCLTANLFDHYVTTNGMHIEKRILS